MSQCTEVFFRCNYIVCSLTGISIRGSCKAPCFFHLCFPAREVATALIDAVSPLDAWTDDRCRSETFPW